MKRRPMIHLLLALVLLISQQIGLSHLISHGGVAQVRLAGDASQVGLSQLGLKALDTDAPVKLLSDQSCQECLFLGQLGTALSSRLPLSPQSVAGTAAVLAPLANWQLTASPSPFLSRAPPLV